MRENVYTRKYLRSQYMSIHRAESGIKLYIYFIFGVRLILLEGSYTLFS